MMTSPLTTNPLSSYTMINIIEYDADASQEASRPTSSSSSQATAGVFLARQYPLGPRARRRSRHKVVTRHQ
jgi:hypothetical protein